MAKLGNDSEQEEEVRPDYSDLLTSLEALPTEDDMFAPDDSFGVELETLTTAAGGGEDEEPLDVGCLLEGEIDDLPEPEEGVSLFAASECAELLLVPEADASDEEALPLTESFQGLLSVPPELPSEPGNGE